MSKQRETRERVLELIEELGVGDAIPSERQLGLDLVRLAADRARRARRARARGLPRPPPRRRDVRRRAEGREGHRHHVVQRRHARPRAHAGEPHDRACGRSPAGARLGRILHVSPSEPVVAVKRLRLADGEPMAIELLHVRSSLVPGLTAADLEENSFYDLLASRWDVAIVGGTQTVEPTVTNDEESAALGVPLHSPALLFERVTRCGDRRRGRVHELDLPRRPVPARHRDRDRRPGASAGGGHRTRPVGKLVLTFR